MEAGQDGNQVAALPRRQFLKGALAGGTLLATSLATAACGGTSSRGTGSTVTTAGVTPKKGGSLRIAMTGGSSSDTLDANAEVTAIDTTRMYALYNGPRPTLSRCQHGRA